MLNLIKRKFGFIQFELRLREFSFRFDYGIALTSNKTTTFRSDSWNSTVKPNIAI